MDGDDDVAGVTRRLVIRLTGAALALPAAPFSTNIVETRRMAFTPTFVDLVRNYTITQGTGPFVLGPPVQGFTSFASALKAGDQFYYSAIGVDKPNEREVGRGTLQSDGTIARSAIGGVATNFTGGSKTVALIAAAEWFNTVQAAASGGGAGGSGGAPVAATRAVLASTLPATPAVMLAEAGREGTFMFDSSNLAAKVSADPKQGLYVAPASDTTGASGAWVRKFDGPVSLAWFGAKGDGTTDDTAAIQAAFNYLSKSTANGNVTLFAQLGNYKITDTIAPPSAASNFIVEGVSGHGSQFVWAGTAGKPMFKFTEARRVILQDVGFVGNPAAKPSFAIQIERNAALNVGGAAPMLCQFNRIFVGHVASNAFDKGIAFTGTTDSNNEQSTIFDCEISHCTMAGVHYGHSNSLWHRIIGGCIDGCGAAVSNYVSGGTGGGFSTYGLRTTGNTVIYQIGPSRKTINIFDHQSESDQGFLNTPDPITTSTSLVNIVGADFSSANRTLITWNCSRTSVFGRLSLRNCYGTSALTIDLPGTAPAFFENCSISLSSLKINGLVTIRDWLNGDNNLASRITNYGTGKCLFENDGLQPANASVTFSTATPSVLGWQHRGILLVSAPSPISITDFPDGFDGQEFTLLFLDANVTIANGTVIKTAATITSANGTMVTFRKVATFWRVVAKNS